MKITKYVSKAIIFFLTILVGYILLWCFIFNKYKVFSISEAAKLYLLIGSFIFFILLFIVNKWINKTSNRKLKIFNIFMVLVLLFIQYFLISNFNTMQITDPFYINDYAISIANKIDTVVDNSWSNYFLNYKNNNFVLLFTIGLIKLANIVSITNYSKFLIFVNAFMIDISILITYFIAKKFKDSKMGSLVLFLSVLNPLNYFMIFWTYTATYSLPFITFIILLWIYLYKNSKFYYIYAFLFGITAVIGYLMRPTMIILLIAILLIFILDLFNKKITFNKRIFNILLIILLTSILTYSLIKTDEKRFFHDQDNVFPITHWIMVGLKGDGTIKEEYNRFTESYETNDEKKEKTYNEIIKTLKKYKFVGLTKHILKKTPITWDDGTANYMIRMKDDRQPSKIYNYVVGDRSDLIKLYCQIFRIVTYVYILVYLVKSLFDKNYKCIDICSLILMGAIVFYIIWEAKNAYSIPFLPIMLIIQGKGILGLSEKISVFSDRHIMMTLLIITSLIFILDYNNFTNKNYSFKDYSIYVSNSSGRKEIDNIVGDSISLKQEFYANKKFNEIELLVKVIDNNSSKYSISLINEDKVLYKTILGASDINNGIYKIKIPSNGFNPGKYFIMICKESGKKDSISFYYLSSKMLDNYDGNLIINNNLYKNDLFMKVYYAGEKPYCSKLFYILFCLLVISLEIFIIKKNSSLN